MAAYLWQAFTAEQMNRNSFGRRCYRYEEEWQPGSLTWKDMETGQMRNEAKIHIIRMDKTGHTTLAEFTAEDADAAVTAFREQLDAGYYAVVTKGEGHAEQVRELPLDADLVVDARFLPNPHWIPELRPMTGRDPEVRDYVLSQEDAEAFLDRYLEVLRLLVPGYRREGKRYLTLAVGCTGGKHRSVAMAEEFARRLTAEGVPATARHRDLGRE